jgi:hypothetical protein
MSAPDVFCPRSTAVVFDNAAPLWPERPIDQCVVTSPRLCARASASARFSAPSFMKMCLTCDLTVSGAMARSRAISLLERPCQPPPIRDRKLNHDTLAMARVFQQTARHVAIVPGDDRMHLRLGQAARHDAQDQASRPRQRRYRLHAQSDRLQPDPHSQTAGGVGQRLLTTSRSPQTPGQKDGKCTNLQVLQQTASQIRVSRISDQAKSIDGWYFSARRSSR